MYNIDCFFELENQEIIEKMHKRREEALEKLKHIINPFFAQEFFKILHYCWQENLPEAERIADILNIYPLDFSAFCLDEKEFKELLMKEERYNE